MVHRHPEAGLLRKFLRGEATPAELRDLVSHLLEACPECGAAAAAERPARLPAPAAFASAGALAGAGGAEALDSVIDRVRSRIQPSLALMERARAEAPGLLSELERHPPERQKILIRNTPRFQSLPLADLLLETAWNLRLERPEEAEAKIAIALELLDRSGPSPFGEGLRNDLRGRAWAYRGNLLRIRSELLDSEDAFRHAESFLEQGTGDPLESARLLGLRATLRRLQGRLDEAAELIQASVEIYQALGEHHLAGRTMVNQAILLEAQGDPATALEVLRAAQDLVEPERDPYLARVMQQNQLAYLTELGRYEEAMTLIPGLRRRVVDGGSQAELLRLRWREGKLLLALGHDRRAEAAFLEVRKGFVELGIAHDAALVSLELASLYLRQGRTAEIRDLVRQLVPIFQSRSLHQEAIAALLLFQRAVEMDTLTCRIVEEVAEVVRRSRERPRSRSEDPS